MKKKKRSLRLSGFKKILNWTPRVIALLLIGLTALLSIDVFGEYGFPVVLLALFMHLIPSFILAGILIVAWKKGWGKFIGGIFYLALGWFYMWLVGGRADTSSMMILPGIVILTGVLFLVDWVVEKVYKK